MQNPGEPWTQLFAWIESELGGRVVDFERQERWRPAFFVDFERNGERLPLYFRGVRPEIAEGAAAIAHEARVLQELERGGIPVPHVYGVCPEPYGIVMERSPGRANLASSDSTAEREAVLDHYVEILARMHALDVGPFEAMGIERPASARELGLCDLARWESTYRKGKSRPEPLIEFVLGWLKRSVPEGRSRVSFLAVDAAQFLFEESEVTALLDFELACLGDPAADLAAFRARDLSEPLGDIPAAYARYFELTGDTIPTSVIDYHTVRFNIYTPMAVAALVANPMPGLDLIQYLGWYWVYSLAPLEVLAHGLGVEVGAQAFPDAAPTRESKAHDALVERLRKASSGEGFAAYEMGASLRVAEYLRRAERYGPALEAEDLAEASALLDRSVKDWSEADRLLEALVEEAGPERDAELVRFFCRRARRQVWLLDPVLRELEGSKVQLLD
jgi:aminoglycoside phosphotransferase (APT) family kinase protein